MKSIFSKNVAILLILAVLSSCGKKDESFEIDLSKQPFDVVQKYVEGKWKWIFVTRPYIQIPVYPTNTFVHITKDRVVITGDDGSTYAFSYSWKKNDLYPGISHVLWNNTENRGMWYFTELINDTLTVESYNDINSPNKTYSAWLRIK